MGGSHEDDKVDASGYTLEHLNGFLHLETLKEGMSSNVELPIVVDFHEYIYETVMYSSTDFWVDSGSYLVLICLAIVLIFGVLSMIFVNVYVSQLKQLIHTKYVE